MTTTVVASRPTARGDETGSILPLVAVFAAVALVLILVVASAGSLYLERKRLFTLADGAALAAAESFDLGDAAISENGVIPTLDPDAAGAATLAFLLADPDPRTRTVAVAAVRVDDGRSATVTLTTVWRPDFLLPVLPDGVPLEATATARSVFR